MDLSIVSQFMSLTPDMMYKATKMVESAAAYFPGDVESQEKYLRENLIDQTLEYALTLVEDKKMRDYMGVSVYTNGTTFSAPTLALYNVASMPEMKQRIQAKLNAKNNVRKEETDLDEAKREENEEDWRKDEIRNYRRHKTTGTTTPFTDRTIDHYKNRGVKKQKGVKTEETELVQEKKRPKLKGRKFNGKNPWWNSDGDDKPYEPGDDVKKTRKESIDYVAELYKGRHGQSEKEYQAGRSDAGKRISGDAETGPNYYTKGRARGAKPDAPTAPGAKPVNTPKLSSSEKEYHQYNKSGAKNRAQYNRVGGSKGLPEEFATEAKNKAGKEQGADGKACWKGYKYAGTENGKDKCVKMEDIADVAAEYFMSEGLNEYGVDILIEEMGIDAFCDFVTEISDEFMLSEARTLVGKKKTAATGKARGVSLKAAPGKTTKAAVEKYGTTRKLSGSSSSGTIKKAAKKQPETKSTSTQTKEKSKGGILGALKSRAERDINLVKKSVNTARQVGTRRAAEVKATYDAVRARGKEAEKSAAATRARRKATVATGRAAQQAGRTAVKAAGAAGAAAGSAVKARQSGKSIAATAGRALGTFVKKMTKEEKELLTQYFIESEIAFNYDEVTEIFESLDQEHFDYYIEKAMMMVEETEPSARETIEEKLESIYGASEFSFSDWRQLTEKKSSEDEATSKFVGITKTNRTDNEPNVKGKRKDGVIINPQIDMRREEVEEIEEKAPPGKKYERMVKHIKKGYSEGGLTKKERGIAYATAWKKYNEETTPAQDQQKLNAQKQMARKQLMLQQQRLQMQKQGKLPVGHAMEEVDHVDEATRYSKETGKSFRTGKPTSKGGTMGGSDTTSRALRSVMKSMGSGRAGVQPRGQKKEPGKKPAKAGEYGGPVSPAQKVAKRRADAQRAKDMMSSRFD
jgi:hypothetical protein